MRSIKLLNYLGILKYIYYNENANKNCFCNKYIYYMLHSSFTGLKIDVYHLQNNLLVQDLRC